MNRRTFLAAAPVVGLAGLPVAALAVPTQDRLTPIMRLYREWRRVFDNEGKGLTDDEFTAACFQNHKVSVQIENTPSETLQDLAAKIIASSGDGAFEIDMAVIRECRALIA